MSLEQETVCHLIKKDIFHDMNILDGELGSGSYGRVYLAKYKEKEYAIKEQEIRDCISQSILVEVDLLQRFRSSSVLLSTEGICLSDNIYIFMPVYDMNLSYYIENTPVDVRRDNFPIVFESCLTALAVLGQYNIAHFDIKPDNILLKTRHNRYHNRYHNKYDDMIDDIIYEVVLADYGLSQYVYEEDLHYPTVKYSIFYRPPEHVFSYNPETFYQTSQPTEAIIRNASAADIWALGCVFAEYITGKPLFDVVKKKKEKGVESAASYEEILISLHAQALLYYDEYYPIPNDFGFGYEGWERYMLCFEADERLSAFQILQRYRISDLFHREMEKSREYLPPPLPKYPDNMINDLWFSLMSLNTSLRRTQKIKCDYIMLITAFWLILRIGDTGQEYTCLSLASTYFGLTKLDCPDMREVYSRLHFTIFTDKLTPLLESLYDKYGSNSKILTNLDNEMMFIVNYFYSELLG